jgi:hypothetical protein
MRPLFAAAGVDFDQWKALTVVALKLDFRTSSLGQSQFRREARQVFGLLGQFLFYTIVGAFLAVLVWRSQDLFLVGTVAMSYTMFAVGTAVLVDHNSALTSPADYGVLGFRPITSRTYFASRLTNVLLYTSALTTVAAWIPIAFLFLRHGAPVGIAGIAGFYACSISTALAILLAYAWMLRAVGADAVKRGLSYLQFLVSFVVYGGYFLLAGTISRELLGSGTLAKSLWLLVFPATWFGAYLELASGKTGPEEVLPALASLLAMGGLFAALGSRLSLAYSERLAALTAAPAEPRAGRAAPQSVTGWLFRSGEARAVALLVRGQFRNDLRFRLGVLAVLPITLIYLGMALRNGSVRDPFVAGSGETGFMPVTIALVMFPSLLKLQLTYSDAFRASWVFFAGSADRLRILRSSKNVLLAFFLVPYLLFVIALYSYLIGNVIHVAVHIALLGMLAHLVLQVALLVDPALPFSRPPQRGGSSIVMLAFLLVTAAASTVLDIFSAVVYSRTSWTAGLFLLIGGAGVVVDRLTRARVDRQARSLEFEG